MKFYETPDFTKVEFFTENVLDGSTGVVIGKGEATSDPVEMGKVDIFGNN